MGGWKPSCNRVTGWWLVELRCCFVMAGGKGNGRVGAVRSGNIDKKRAYYV